MRSIQTKFIALTLSCVLLCSAVIGGTAIYNANRVVESDSARIMNLQCGERALEFDNLLARVEQSVKTLSVYALQQLESVERLKTDDAYREAYTQRMQDVAVNAANSTEGALAVYLRFNPKFAPSTSGLFWSKTSRHSNFERLTPTDFSLYSPSDTEHVGWYYVPVQRGKPTWMAPYQNKNINVRMISYVIPLYRDNEVVGVVGMDIDFTVLEDMASAVRLYETGYAFLSNDTGVLLYHPQYAIGTQMESADDTLLPVVSELRNGSSGTTLFPYHKSGQAKMMAFRTLRNGMRLAITAPLTEIDAVKNTLIVQSLLGFVCIAVLSVLLTVCMTRRLVRPLKELNIAAKKIANGDLSITLTRSSKDEVGMLADSFRQTAHHLQTYINYINALAYRDALTGVKNKTAYQEAERRLDEQIHLGRPAFAVVVCDINGLKAVNDRYGHDFGDMLVMDACKLICRTFKRSPVYRVGGDEFVCILENGDYEQYAQLMENFRNGMDEYNRTARPDSYVSVARGVAVYDDTLDLTFASVFKRADDAMYQNKAAMKAQAVDLGTAQHAQKSAESSTSEKLL